MFSLYLLTGFYRKISLPNCDNFFSWVSVLYDQVADIAREQDIVHFALCTGADRNHFANLGKMVIHNICKVVSWHTITFDKHAIFHITIRHTDFAKTIST